MKKLVVIFAVVIIALLSGACESNPFKPTPTPKPEVLPDLTGVVLRCEPEDDWHKHPDPDVETRIIFHNNGDMTIDYLPLGEYVNGQFVFGEPTTTLHKYVEVEEDEFGRLEITLASAHEHGDVVIIDGKEKIAGVDFGLGVRSQPMIVTSMPDDDYGRPWVRLHSEFTDLTVCYPENRKEWTPYEGG